MILNYNWWRFKSWNYSTCFTSIKSMKSSLENQTRSSNDFVTFKSLPKSVKFWGELRTLPLLLISILNSGNSLDNDDNSLESKISFIVSYHCDLCKEIYFSLQEPKTAKNKRWAENSSSSLLTILQRILAHIQTDFRASKYAHIW